MGKNTERRSRYKILKESDSSLCTLPSVERNLHILRWLDELGYYGFGANGILPITHVELAAWQSNVCEKIEPEEALLLRELSSEFVNYYNRSKDWNEPPPNGATDEVVQGAHFLAILGGIGKKPSK